MTKQLYISELQTRLSWLPQKDREDQIRHYGKMVDGVISYGYTEDAATAEVGDINEIAIGILSAYPLPKLVKERIRRLRDLKPREIVLLSLTSPIWISLLIAMIAVALFLYLAVCAVVISMWVVGTSLEIVSLIATAAGIVLLFWGELPKGFAVIGAGLFGVGFSVLIFFVSRAATKGLRILTQKMFFNIKRLLIIF
ncbi:MAG: DUF1700 domain-containing protein [Ruminococcus sp.]|nr:DUF1700 domain-containing protein [Ruminococcus sp.]